MVVYKDLERISKQLAGLGSADLTSGLAKQAMSLQQIPNPTAWIGVKAVEQQWLRQHKFDVMPSSNVIAQSLSQVPETGLSVLQRPEWLTGLSEVSRNVGSYFAQINTMVETVADAIASPLARIAEISEEFTPPIQGWQQLVNTLPSFRNFEGVWEGLHSAVQDLMEDAEAGREVLKASEFGFADHFWGMFYIRGFAHINERVRPAIVTNKLLAVTTSEEYVEELQNLIGTSKLMHKRWRIIESICEAHAAKKYDLAVPATLAQIEGTLVDLMFLKDLVKKKNGKFYLIDEIRDFELKNDRKRKPRVVTLRPAITNAKLEEHPNLAAASGFIANTLVQRRNAVLHGRDLTYGKAKFSVQALLILTVLAEGVSELESGNTSSPSPL